MRRIALRMLRKSLHGRAALAHGKSLGRWPNLVRPRTFNEKVLRKCLHDRRPLLAQTADKVAVRNFVKERIGGEYLADLIQVIERPGDIEIGLLPSAFAAKANPASGPEWCRIVTGLREGETNDLHEDVARW